MLIIETFKEVLPLLKISVLAIALFSLYYLIVKIGLTLFSKERTTINTLKTRDPKNYYNEHLAQLLWENNLYTNYKVNGGKKSFSAFKVWLSRIDFNEIEKTDNGKHWIEIFHDNQHKTKGD